MTITLSTTEAYDRGRKMAQGRLTGMMTIEQSMKRDFTWARGAYLGAENLDFESAILTFSRERMASELDLVKYPECRGLREVVEATRKGFADVMNDPFKAAYCLDWYWFVSRRLNTRYVGKNPPPAQCTDFWFADTKEGSPIHGSNRDDLLFGYRGINFHEKNTPRGVMKPETFTKVTCIGGVSSAVLCDEEPECLFPVDLGMVIPDGITDVKEYVGYLEKYKEFWGPGNQLWTDANMNFVALEKANVRMGARYSTGCCAITACSYVIPEMNAFKKERDLMSYRARGWDENDNPDKSYWAGDESRYRRLLELVRKEHDRGATLLGAAEIALDHAVPFPARVNIQGQTGHPQDNPEMQNWSMITNVWCLSGPNTRSYNWVIDPDNPRPVYETECFIIPGEGQEHRLPEWEAEIRAAGEIGLHPPA